METFSSPSSRTAGASQPDVLVIGGGVIGCSVALQLAGANLQVHVLEKSVPGAEASSAAAGMLGPEFELHPTSPPALWRATLQSRALYASLAAELRECTGVDIGLARCGALRVALDADELPALDALRAHLEQLDVHANWFDAEALRAEAPTLCATALGALELPDVFQLEPRRLTRALRIAAERRGVRFLTQETVLGVLHRGERVEGVALADRKLFAPHVVVAAGSWSSLLQGLPLPPGAVFPVRGQIVRCEMQSPPLRRILVSQQGYVVPRPTGEILCGSTEEHVGFTRGVTVGGVAAITAHATHLLPPLQSAVVTGTWSNFRPGTKAGQPWIGGCPLENLWLATGHFRNGILWAPITAEIIRRSVLGEALSAEMQSFRLREDATARSHA